MKQTCKFCGYKWTARVDNPKACPRCKSRKDYVYRERVNPEKKEKEEK